MKECSCSVLVRIFAKSNINFRGFQTAMGCARQCNIQSVQSLDQDYFQVFLDNEEQVQFVLHNGPWNFENQLVLVRLWTGHGDPHAHDFDTKLFWFHAVGLPRYCYTGEVGHKLSKIVPRWT